jgi:hypothetical protein
MVYSPLCWCVVARSLLWRAGASPAAMVFFWLERFFSLGGRWPGPVFRVFYKKKRALKLGLCNPMFKLHRGRRGGWDGYGTPEIPQTPLGS